MATIYVVGALLAFPQGVAALHIQPSVTPVDQPLAPSASAEQRINDPVRKKCPTSSQGISQFIHAATSSLPTQQDVVNMIQGEANTYPIIGSPQTWKANFDKVYPPAAEQKTITANATAPVATGKVRDLYTKCQYAGNLSYCGLVDYKVPFYGWYEWAQYQEQCLEHYIEYYYKDKDTSPECIEAMKNMGCASYFPRCEGQDAEGRDLYLKPCRSLCDVWKYDLKCPGSEAIECKGDNPQSINFARYGSCTDYGAQPLPPPTPNTTKPVAPKPTMAPPPNFKATHAIKQVETKSFLATPPIPATPAAPANQATIPALNMPTPPQASNAVRGLGSEVAPLPQYPTESLQREGGDLATAPPSMSAAELPMQAS